MSQNHDLAPASTALRRWSSRNYPPRERLEGYLDQVEKSLFASSITPVASRDFHANLNEARFAHGRAVRFTATPHLVSRLTAEVAKTSEDTIVAGLHLSPGVRVKVKDVLVDRAQGDLVAIESSTQFSLETNRAAEFSMLSLLFDARRIDGYAGRSRRRVWKLLGHQPATSTLRACIELFGRRFSQQAPAGELAALFDACEALVATVFIEDRDFAEATSRTRSNVRAGLLLAVIDYCEKNVRNPALSPLHVASAFGISTRYLHKLFEDDGTSFSTFVLNRRLDGVHAALTSETPNRLSIGDMSAFWGFENRATFNRNFKRRFQLTPSQATRRRVASEGCDLDDDISVKSALNDTNGSLRNTRASAHAAYAVDRQIVLS